MVGTTALMFHDRQSSLRKMRKLVPPLQTSQLDYSLWLARSPPEGLEHHRAAFIWWTSTHYKMRRLEFNFAQQIADFLQQVYVHA